MLQHVTATRYEGVVAVGRTRPLILACRGATGSDVGSQVVKAVGCPEIFTSWQLVAEVVGNAMVRRMGVPTADPSVVLVSDTIARLINEGLERDGQDYRIVAGEAAGCSLLRPPPAPITYGQSYTPAQRAQAVRLYVFDLMSQHVDRRPEKPNCGIVRGELLAFDFEMCFNHLWLPLIGRVSALPWEPGATGVGRNHLFRPLVQAEAPGENEIRATLDDLSDQWWDQLLTVLPAAWVEDARRIREAVRAVRDHAAEFSRDVARTLQ
jgi:hypothetical protein